MDRKKDERSETRRAIAKAILEEYKPITTEEMQEALRDIFGPMFEAMFQGEMENHLGYESNDRGTKGQYSTSCNKFLPDARIIFVHNS